MIDALIAFLRDISSKGISFFIEAEGRPQRIRNFVIGYNTSHNEFITEQSEGIILLDENSNKWGLELRLYVTETPPPTLLRMFTRNTVYRSEYRFRLNDNGLISQLLNLGYKVGFN